MRMFTYTNLRLPYYAFGIQQVRLSDQQNVMIASPEKALFDKIVRTDGGMLRRHNSGESEMMRVLNPLLSGSSGCAC